MGKCLGDRALVLMCHGDGEPSDWAHVQSCVPCTARYRRVARDVAAIGETLAAGPPLAPRRHARRLSRRVLAAAVVAALVVGGAELWMWHESRWLVARTITDGRTEALLRELAAVVDTADDRGTPSLVATTVPEDATDELQTIDDELDGTQPL